jgi:hypothetical protein
MDASFNREMVRASRRLTVADWENLLLRSDFDDLTIFVRLSTRASRELLPRALLKDLRPTFEKLIREAKWSVLYSSARRLATSWDSDLKDRLQSILSDYLSAIDLDAQHFHTFEEAIQCVGSLWWGVPPMRDNLAQSIFDILPNETGWYREAGFLRNVRVPLLILASSEIEHESDARMLDLCNTSEVAGLVATTETFDVLLYLWYFYSLWFKREKTIRTELRTTFASFLNPEIRAVANRILDERLQRRADQPEKMSFVSLCGFLHASGLATFTPDDKAAWVTRLPMFEQLLELADDMKSFLTRSFFLIGLGHLFDRSKDIPRETFLRILPIMEPYQEPTEAFRNWKRSLTNALDN